MVKRHPHKKFFRINVFCLGGVLSYFRSFFGQKELRILILGLDGAGKTTILYRLQVSVASIGSSFQTSIDLPCQNNEV